MIDSTPDKDAQARINELEERLRTERIQFALAERAAQVGYWRLTLPDYRITPSQGVYSLLGLDPHAATGPSTRLEDHFFAGFQRNDIGELLRKIETTIHTRSRLWDRRRFLGVDGSERILEIVGDVELGPDGDVIAVVGATRDVTEQIKATAERENLLELFRIVTEAASDIIMVHDALGNAVFASAALERLPGRTVRNAGADDVVALVHPDDLSEVLEMRNRVAPGKISTATYRMRNADGRYVWFETSMSILYDRATGKHPHIVTVLRDVNERKVQELAIQEALQTAEAANRAKSEFLANMSHELRTPLNAIIGFADVILHELFGSLNNPRHGEYISAIHKSGQHLLALVNDILDMSKIEAGKFELHLEEIDLAETAAECVKTVTEHAASAGVELTVSLSAQSLPCRSDGRAMKQIILNLLSNAIKFTPAGGHVQLRVAIRDNTIHIEVRDDGIGISAEDLPRLAKPFEQVCSDPKLAKNGTGLGLALVRALTEKHGGCMAIESPDKKGAIVTVKIPRFAKAELVAA